MNGIFHIEGSVKHYDWGGFSFIPALLNQDNPTQRPFAEYWLGTHQDGHAKLAGSNTSLNAHTGPFNFLLKVLDVREMLSIQVHPSKKAAVEGFENENRAGIPRDAPHRNYKDANHKPELMVALREFWLLHGFKPVEELHDILVNVSELNSLIPVFMDKGYPGLYEEVMTMDQEKVNGLLRPLAEKLLPLFDAGRLQKSQEDYWAAKAIRSFCTKEHYDRGIFSIYFFNLIRLQKGEAIFQDAGLPHAYLEGQNIEVMASSDNVLRGGLTKKHIDIKALLDNVKCEATYPNIISANENGCYQTPVEEFTLKAFTLKSDETQTISVSSPSLAILIEGKITIRDRDKQTLLQPGQPAALIQTDKKIEVSANREALLFIASEK